jgi:hypothetical protein
MRKNFMASLAVTVATCWPLASSAQDGQLSLTETLAWMDKTFNPHEAGSLGYGEYAEYSNGKLMTRRTETFTYVGCKMTLHIQDDPKAAIPGYWYTSRLYSFSLHDIDPASFEISTFDSKHAGLPCGINPLGMTCNMESIFFKTTDKELLLEEEGTTVYKEQQGDAHETHGNNKTFGAFFYLNNLEYADHFAKAFRHAISLCGGKPSPF